MASLFTENSLKDWKVNMSRNWRARNQVMVAKMERERQLLDERQQNRSDLLKGAILAGMIVDEEVTQRKQKKT